MIQPVISAIHVSSGYGLETAAEGLFTPLPRCYFRVRLPQRLEPCRQLISFEDLEELFGQGLAGRDTVLPDAHALGRFEIREVGTVRDFAMWQPGNELL